MSEKGKYDSWWNDTLRALSPGDAQKADEQAEKHAADMRKKELLNNVLEWEQDNRKGMRHYARAVTRFDQNDIVGMVDEMRSIYDIFPDGGKIGKVEEKEGQYFINVTGPDQVERKEPFTYQKAQEYLDLAKRSLNPEEFVKQRSMLNAQQDAFNSVQKQSPQRTADGGYAYQQVDRKGNYKWYTTDENGEAKELKSRPKLLSEVQARQDRERNIRKDEAAIGKINAETRKYEADIEGIKNPATEPPKINDLDKLGLIIGDLGDNPDQAAVALARKAADNLGFLLVRGTKKEEGFFSDKDVPEWRLIPKGLPVAATTPDGRKVKVQYNPKTGKMDVVDDAPGKPQEEKEGGGEESTPDDAIEQDEQEKEAKEKETKEKEAHRYARWLLEKPTLAENYKNQLIREYGEQTGNEIYKRAQELFDKQRNFKITDTLDTVRKRSKELLDNVSETTNSIGGTPTPGSYRRSPL